MVKRQAVTQGGQRGGKTLAAKAMAGKALLKRANIGEASWPTQLIRSTLAASMGYSHGGRRDLYEVLGYPRQPALREIFALYTRNDVANRIVRQFPASTWREAPEVKDELENTEKESADDVSPFHEAVEELFKKHRVLHYMERVDRVASLGRYGVLLMGFKDGKKLSAELTSRKAPLLYLSPYGEEGAVIDRFDEDPKSERFGMPLMYRLSDTGDALVNGATRGRKRSAQLVHWTRVLHVSEFLEEDDVYGMPRLLPVFNRLMDLEKTVGGGAEVYWLNAGRPIALMGDKDANLDEDAIAAMKVQAEEFAHQLRRYFVGSGVTASTLDMQPSDNDKNVDKLLDLIAGAVGIPKRMLIGSERGELASSMDESNWSQVVDHRRQAFAGPMIVTPFVQRMIDTGNVPEPSGEWEVCWTDQGEVGPDMESTIAERKTNTLCKYVSTPGVELLVPPTQFMKDVMKMEPAKDLTDDVLDEQRDAELNAPVPEPGVPAQEAPPIEKAPVPPPKRQRKGKQNASPRTAYVRRDVLNADEINAWLAANGFATRDDLHVTIAYIQKPFDWMKAGNAYDQEVTIQAGGPRTIEFFDGGAVVVEFSSDVLRMRRNEILWSSDVDPSTLRSYAPHVTIANLGDDTALRALVNKPTAYSGAIILGPEIWEALD